MRITVAGEGCWPFFFPVAMTRRPAMSRRLISWPRRWSAAASIASSVTAAPPIDLPRPRADSWPSRVRSRMYSRSIPDSAARTVNTTPDGSCEPCSSPVRNSRPMPSARSCSASAASSMPRPSRLCSCTTIVTTAPDALISLAAVVDLVVGGVPVLDDLQAGVDLAAQLRVGEVVAGEDGPDGPAEFLQGEVDRVLGAAAFREAAQYLVGLGGPQPQRGGVLDHLVVVAGDQVPVDGPFLEDLLQPGPRGLGVAGGVELDRADVLQPGKKLDAEQLGEGEAHEAGAVGVGVVGLDLRAGAVPEQALDHRGDLGG